MWISKKRWKILEKRVADLESNFKSQPANSLFRIRKTLQEVGESPLRINVTLDGKTICRQGSRD